MVHISEVAPTFINEISDYVKVGQEVKVKVLALNDGKISLSMKQALPKEQQQQRKRSDRPQRQNHRSREPYKPAPPVTSPGDYEWQSSRRNAPSSFEDMMSKFKQTSEDKMKSKTWRRKPWLQPQRQRQRQKIKNYIREADFMKITYTARKSHNLRDNFKERCE